MKKALSLFLSILLVFAVIPMSVFSFSASADKPDNTVYFTDITVAGGWYYDAVKYTAEYKIFSGFANRSFGLSKPMQRQDFLVTLARFVNADLSSYNGITKLRDVAPNGYYAKAIAWGIENDVIHGYDDGRFGVGDYVTREQIITFFYRLAKFLKCDTNVNTSVDSLRRKYVDFNSVSPWAIESVVWAIDKKLISGVDATHINPVGKAERCHIAQIYYNIKKNNIFGDKSTPYPSPVASFVLPKLGAIGDIGLVVNHQAETFDGGVVDDKSLASNSFLPQGTVDYIEKSVFIGSREYYLMKYGKRTYRNTTSGKTIVQKSQGRLLAENNISVGSVSESDRFTEIALDVDWKAPFTVQLNNQQYNSDRTITNITYNAVIITFKYCSNFWGDISIPNNHPIFSSYTVTKQGNDTVLKLNLKKTAGLCGWRAFYNKSEQLVFKFLKPAKIVNPAKPLANMKIMVDAGHGGIGGGGSPANKVTNAGLNEAALNLILANKVKTRLEALGATVVMTRTSDSYIDSDDRLAMVQTADADFMISIHRNAVTDYHTSANGFGSYYFNALSKPASQIILDATKNARLYNNNSLNFHYFYMCRCTACPCVLTENGFVTNDDEYKRICSDDYNNKCADALVNGIVNYFKSIQ